MRVLHLSDSHLGAKLRAEGAPKSWCRHADHLAALDAALALADDVDLVVHSGDLFDHHTPPPAVVADAAARLDAVAERVPVVVIAGNHERNGIRSILGARHPRVLLVDAPTRYEVGGLTLGLVPFERDAGRWAHASREAVGAGVDALVHHQGVDGARVPGYTFRAHRHSDVISSAHIPREARWLMSGHIHAAQVVDGEAWTAVYPGSTERAAFVEAFQEKCAVIWEFDAEVRWEWRTLPTRPMRELLRPTEIPELVAGELVMVREPSWVEPALARGAWVVRGRRRGG